MDQADSFDPGPVSGTAGPARPRSAAAEREYLLGLLTQAKLNRKELAVLETDRATWRRRIELAAKAGDSALEMAARGELSAVEQKYDSLLAETEGFEAESTALRKKLPVIAASERSVDPDLLEQELLMAAGREPGSGDELATEQKFAKLEKDSAADAALARLKASMGMGSGGKEGQ